MKFAFSTLCAPEWDLATVAARAKEYGFDGVELMAEALPDPGAAREALAGVGVEIACLATATTMSGHAGQDRALADDVRRHIDTAAQIGCRIVKVQDVQVRRGQNPAMASVALSDWLAPLGDHAADRGVVLVVENARSFRTARLLWDALERLNHPAVGVCWDVLSAAQAGESPFISVPVLNTRIAYVHVQDAKLRGLSAEYCAIGEGDVPVRNLLTRLLGIGYQGYLTLAWDRTARPDAPGAEALLPASLAKLREWSKPPAAEPKAKPAHAAKAAKPGA